MAAFRFSLFLLSMLGYQLEFTGRKHGHAAFSPALTVASIGFITFIGGGGGTNTLLPAAILAFSFGLFLLIRNLFLFIRRKRSLRLNSFLLLMAFAGGSVYLFCFFQKNGSALYWYDEYSHWGLIVRFLLRTDAFPQAADTVISFNTYPLGTSSFIYYFCRIVGSDSVGMMLCGQTYILISLLYSLFAICKNLFETVLAAGVFWTLIHFNISLNCLLVDNILGAAALAIFMLVLYSLEDIKHLSLEAGLLVGFTINIKNSGLFIALLAIGYIFFILYAERCRKLDEYYDGNIRSTLLHTSNPQSKPSLPIKAILVIAGFAVFYFAFWKLHCYLAFTAQGASAGKHSMSISSYLKNFSNSGNGEQWTKTSIIVPIMLSFRRNPALILMLVMIAICAAINFAHLPAEKINHITCLFVLMFLVYEVGLLSMYQFSMSAREVVAQNGNDFKRYNGTLIVPLVGMLFYALLNAFSNLKFKKFLHKTCKMLMMVGCVVLLLLSVRSYKVSFQDRVWMEKNHPALVWLEQMSTTVHFSKDDHVLLLRDKKYTYPHFCNYFVLPCSDVKGCTDEKTFQSEKKTGKYNIVIDAINRTVTVDGKKVEIRPS